MKHKNGWDFYTGKTVNYRDNIGKVVRRKNRDKAVLCSETVLHVSRNPNDAFVGAKIPPVDVFEWDYNLACNPVNPFDVEPPEITKAHIALLGEWDMIWDLAREPVWGCAVFEVTGTPVAWDMVRGMFRESLIRESLAVWEAVRAYVGYIFRNCINNWHTELKPGEYPFRPAVDMWNAGLVPSYDGIKWRLHGGKETKVLWEEESDEA